MIESTKRKIIIVPDSFKGTLNSVEVCDIIESTLKEKYPQYDLVSLPFADGGENTLECFKKALPSSQIKEISLLDANFKERNVPYLRYENSVIFESAKLIGLPLTSIKNPKETSTFGIGEFISKMLDIGVTSFIITLGGSSTNDGGAGLLSALGVRFYHGQDTFIPVGKTLHHIDRIDLLAMDKRLQNASFKLLSDVKNPLLGEKGATYTFAKQKGAKPEDLKQLEANMMHYKEKMKNAFKDDHSSLEGSGAAGGLGFAFSYLRSKFFSGGEFILNLYHFDSLLNNALFIITGEGKTDVSSFDGKAISCLYDHAKKANVPLIILSGFIDHDTKERLAKLGISKAISIYEKEIVDISEILPFVKEDLRQAVVKYI